MFTVTSIHERKIFSKWGLVLISVPKITVFNLPIEKNIALGTPTVTIYITLSGYVASVVGPCGVVVNTSD